MGFFDNDDGGFGIEDLFKQFSEGEGFPRNTPRDSKRMPTNQIMTSKSIFFVFDFSGEKNVSVKISDGVGVNDYGERINTGGKVLEVNSLNKNLGKYVLPKKIKLKTIEYTFKNGVLEVRFKK
jgi:HSP20 family molecular chaperone IbpA